MKGYDMQIDLGDSSKIPPTTLAAAQQAFAGERCFRPAVGKKIADETVIATDSPEFADFFHTIFWVN
jgi:hypothetical protein